MMNISTAIRRAAGLCAFAFACFSAWADGLPVTEGLKFHVDANIGVTTDASGKVTAWADQSDTGLNLTAYNAPIYRQTEQGPGVYFNGTNVMYSTKDAICYSNHTVIIVAAPDKTYEGGSGNTNQKIGDMFGSCRNSDYTANKDILLMCNWDSGKMFRGAVYGSGGNHYLTATKENATGLFIFDQTFDGDVNTLSVRVNGAYLNTSTVTDFNPTASRGVLLGGRNQDAFKGLRFHGDVFEVLVFDRAVTAAERRALNKYLGTKWRVPGMEAGDPVVVTDGLRFRLDTKVASSFTCDANGYVSSYGDGYGSDGLVLAQASAANRPQYREVEGVKSLYFKGGSSGSYMISTERPIPYDTHDIFIVLKCASTAKMGDLYLGDLDDKYSSGGVMMMMNWDDNKGLRACLWKGANYTAIPNRARTTETMIVEQRYDGAKLYGYVNGTSEASTAVTGFSQMGGVNLGGRPAYKNALFNGDMYEVLVYDRALPQIERYRVLQQLYNRWNVQDAFKKTIDDTIALYDAREEARKSCPVSEGLKLWVDASRAATVATNASGVVTSWKDLTTHEYTLWAGGSPTYANNFFLDRAGVYIDGGYNGLSGASGQICYSNHTIFVVAKPKAATNNGEDMFGAHSSQQLVDGDVLMLANKNSKLLRGFYYRTSGDKKVDEYSFGPATTEATLYMQRMTDTTLEASAWKRTGSKDVHSASLGTLKPSLTKTGVSLGGRYDAGYAWHGTFAEVMVYDRALTAAEVTTVENYLRNKWLKNDFTVKVNDDGTVNAITVSDTSALVAGTVTLDGDPNKLKPGDYTLVTAAGISVGQQWTLNAQPSRRPLRLTAQDGRLVLTVARRGLTVLFY